MMLRLRPNTTSSSQSWPRLPVTVEPSSLRRSASSSLSGVRNTSITFGHVRQALSRRAPSALRRIPTAVALLGCTCQHRRRLDDRGGLKGLRGVEGRRGFFGLGEIVGVIANPSEVLKSLRESKQLLEEARQEMQENKEREQIPTSHTFSPLPGFYDRPKEIQALERALGSVPVGRGSFTVLFGASSVGKTALLRQVLSQEQYHCIHFDLRIAGFADLQSLYFSLAQQMEGYFGALPEMMGEEWGWRVFEKESWAFKHDRLAIEDRVSKGGVVKTSDIAHLMELFQSALLKYWQFEPMSDARRAELEQEQKGKGEENGKGGSKKGDKNSRRSTREYTDTTEAKMRQGAVRETDKKEEIDVLAARSIEEQKKKNEEEKEVQGSEGTSQEGEEEVEEPKPPPKKVPVLFLDEAHKYLITYLQLPALIKTDPDAMKSLLDSMLVLTKQDRLCHVIHATSDPFYMHWLRQLNVMQHCNILSIGDCSKEEARAFHEEVLLPHVPDILQSGFAFETLYEVFGGKLAHLSDYTAEYINSDGKIKPELSSHFLQAHSLLNLQLIHSLPMTDSAEPNVESAEQGGSGFSIYSPLVQASPHAASSPFNSDPSSQLAAAGASGAAGSGSDFSTQSLLLVMSRLRRRFELPYFPLCRELGARAVDGMVRGRVLELRWSRTITEERTGAAEERVKRGGVQGPVVVATTPVLHHAMAAVLDEYKEEGKEVPEA
ncbi:BZ3500_MvSof-1268-A1-R1_Chr4-2g06970 [Microbotryum saponariae]|uniref:BZ3500_MvSof-1268-A1-R1_Chr4-2g06970 protein n=1 Tax=Microbotryum saponariae TaxID=289078 RepID=A0A2X0KSK6_9BASI|nr:BZ3500_MvSof-1268-A1-R1_Chr4-2g06970 [Microbotryum saponariae]SDA06635.1 BZ3501_MvSof-1269-A2-R1_Chr4-2g06681 [Microbotryum saponariae]